MNAQERIETAREAIAEMVWTLETIQSAIESAEDEARDTLETDYPEKTDDEIEEMLFPIALENVEADEALSVLRGQLQDLSEAL